MRDGCFVLGSSFFCFLVLFMFSRGLPKKTSKAGCRKPNPRVAKIDKAPFLWLPLLEGFKGDQKEVRNVPPSGPAGP